MFSWDQIFRSVGLPAFSACLDLYLKCGLIAGRLSECYTLPPTTHTAKIWGQGTPLALWSSPSSFCRLNGGTASLSHRDLDHKQLGSAAPGKTHGLLRCGKARRFSPGLNYWLQLETVVHCCSNESGGKTARLQMKHTFFIASLLN